MSAEAPVTEAAPVAPAPAPEAPAPSSAKPDRAKIVAELKERLRKQREDDDAPEPAAKPVAADSKAEVVAEKIEAAGGDAPDQRKGESDAQYEIRLTKALRDLRDAKAEALKSKRAADEAAAEAGKLRALLESGKANPLEILSHFGMTFEDLVKGINEEKFKPKSKGPELPPEILEKIDRLERADREREAERVKATAEAQHTKDVEVTSKYITEHADDFPLAATMPWAAKSIVDDAYAEGTTNVGPILERLENALQSNVMTLFGSDKATKALLQKHPKLRESLMAAMGDGVAAQKTEAPKRGVATAAGLEAESAPKKLTREEKAKRLASELADWRRQHDDD